MFVCSKKKKTQMDPNSSHPRQPVTVSQVQNKYHKRVRNFEAKLEKLTGDWKD